MDSNKKSTIKNLVDSKKTKQSLIKFMMENGVKYQTTQKNIKKTRFIKYKNKYANIEDDQKKILLKSYSFDGNQSN